MDEDKWLETEKADRTENLLAADEAGQAAEEAAHDSLPAGRRAAGQSVGGLKKIYYKLIAGRLSQLQEQVIDQDRELSELSHDVGQLTAQVIQMNRLQQAIEARLARLEEGQDAGQSEDDRGQ